MGRVGSVATSALDAARGLSAVDNDDKVAAAAGAVTLPVVVAAGELVTTLIASAPRIEAWWPPAFPDVVE